MDNKNKNIFGPVFTFTERRRQFMLMLMSDIFEAELRERNNPNSNNEEFDAGIKIKPSREYPKYDINGNKEQ